MIKVVLVTDSSPADIQSVCNEICSRLIGLRDEHVIDGLVEVVSEKACGNGGLSSYHAAVARLEQIFSGIDPSRDRVIGILDLPAQHDLANFHALTSFMGRLMLSFPEFLWVPFFGEDLSGLLADPDESQDCHVTAPLTTLMGAIKLCQAGYSPLFDGDGLRSSIVADRVVRDENKSCRRTDFAVAIDEERQFAYMNAYAAYRFGYRAVPVVTLQCAKLIADQGWLADRCWGQGQKNVLSAGSVRPRLVVFEDVCLEFPDNDNLGDREKNQFGTAREAIFPILRQADLRIITTAALPTERVARDDGGERLTCKEYFNGRLYPNKTVCRASKAGRLNVVKWIRLAGKALFNVCSGSWCGFWLVNTIVAIGAVLLLTAVFFWKPVCILPAFVLCFLVFGVAGEIVDDGVKRCKTRPGGLLGFLKRRQQWQYMPKQYQNFSMTRLPEDGSAMYWCEARKPLTGIFGLRNIVGLPIGQGFKGVMSTSDVLDAHRRFMRHQMTDEDLDRQDHVGHAAPGMAVEIASVLIHRAEKTKSRITGVEGAIYGAVLANSALELLGNKTPALSIEALGLKHYYEVLAECEFVGVQASLDMDDRYVDLHNAMWKICRSSEGTLRDDVFVSGMAQVVDQLLPLLHDHGKLEEASYFARISRRLHRQLKSPIIRSILAYPEWVLRRKLNFFISFGASLSLFCAFCMVKLDCDFLEALKRTYLVLLANQPDVGAAVAEFQVVGQVMRQIALIHLGFLAAAFYEFMNRK